MIRTITIAALILCTSFFAHAQVEQAAQQMAENEYGKFAKELPTAFKGGKDNIFGLAKTGKKQFFLEDNAATFSEFLGWDKKKFSSRTISSVFKALSEATKGGKKNPNPVSVTFDLPDQPTEVKVTIKKDPKGASKKESVVTYVVTTRADVMVEASKGGSSSLAHNNVAMVWEGKLNLLNGEVNTKKKNAPPVLRSITLGPAVGFSEPKEEQMRARAKDLIEEYYQNLQSPAKRVAVLSPEIPNKAEFEKWLQDSRRIVVEGNISVPMPDAKSQTIVVRNVPGVRIYVDPAPFMTEDISQYSRTDAYYQLILTFTVDFQNDKIAKVVYDERFVGPELAPKQVVIAEPEPVKQPVAPPPAQKQPVVSGEFYKIQILSLQTYKDVSELPQKYRVENVVVEKYSDGFYKYVVPAGPTLREAFAVLNQMIARGIDDAWIAVYLNGERVRPLQASSR